MQTLRLSLAGTAMVVLLGGFAAPTAGQEPSSEANDFLPGVDLVTEELEPGVHRVKSDGVRDLSRPLELGSYHPYEPPGFRYQLDAREGRAMSGNENGVWMASPDGIVRLGEDGLVRDTKGNRSFHEHGVAPDDTLYRPSDGRILRGGTWKSVTPRIKGFEIRNRGDILFAPDGSLWVEGTNGKKGDARRDRLARRDADGWSLVKPPPAPPERSTDRESNISRWGVSGDGTLYVTRDNSDVQRFDGTRWTTLERPPGQITALRVGRDGTVWVTTRKRQTSSRSDPERFFRADDSGWSEAEVGRRYPNLFQGAEVVGLDGALWYRPGGDPMISGGCDGIARTDGTATTHFLRGLCVYDMTIGPGGDIWLEAGSWEGNYWIPDEVGPIELYLIEAEAVVADE